MQQKEILNLVSFATLAGVLNSESVISSNVQVLYEVYFLYVKKFLWSNVFWS